MRKVLRRLRKGFTGSANTVERLNESEDVITSTHRAEVVECVNFMSM